ncbi:MAG TPA: methyltransferase domain-containing protein [Thermoanaerobaculia bacterium]
MFRKFLRLRRLEGTLRSIQREYYATSRDQVPELFPRYARALAEARALTFAAEQGRRPATGRETKLHLGCGDHHLEGWWNVDLERRGELQADLSRSIPVRSGSVDYVHSEDFLEHVDLPQGRRLLSECFRVLRPGGVMRLLTPDLRAIVERVYLERQTRHLTFCRVNLQAEGPCEALNMWLRMEGGAHRFVWDYELLERGLTETGFTVRRVSFNRSWHASLRYLDLRDFDLNLFVEATKPLEISP